MTFLRYFGSFGSLLTSAVVILASDRCLRCRRCHDGSLAFGGLFERVVVVVVVVWTCGNI